MSRKGKANRPEGEKRVDQTVFTFRLNGDDLEWFLENAPKAESRHLRMQALVSEYIQSRPTFRPTINSPMQSVKNSLLDDVQAYMEEIKTELRNYVRGLIKDGGKIASIQEAHTNYQSGGMGDDVPDDLIDNILEGL